MDLMKYIIVGIGCVLLGIIIAFVAHSIFAGLGIMILSFAGYILVNWVNSVKPVSTTDTPSLEESPKQDN